MHFVKVPFTKYIFMKKKNYGFLLYHLDFDNATVFISEPEKLRAFTQTAFCCQLVFGMTVYLQLGLIC